MPQSRCSICVCYTGCEFPWSNFSFIIGTVFIRCGYEFCYTCGAEWKNKAATCACPLWDEEHIMDDSDEELFDEEFDEDEDEENYESDSDDYY